MPSRPADEGSEEAILSALLPTGAAGAQAVEDADAEATDGGEGDGTGDSTGTGAEEVVAPLVERAFGEENRARLIGRYFEENGTPTAADAWKHVYRLLLWVDPTIGLAHCYESDKCQPGKPWYLRSLGFHAWLAEQFGTTPADLASRIDWLFERANEELTRAAEAVQRVREELAQTQRGVFPDLTMPVPGQDPETIRLLEEGLGPYLAREVPDETWRKVSRALRRHVGAENKRRNLVGEGFEDVLAAVIRRVVPDGTLDVKTRTLLGDIPGFARAVQLKGEDEKPNKVDLALATPPAGSSTAGGQAGRSLVTVKWSIRADREKQFPAEFASYTEARSDRVPFSFVLVTNEFDPARLRRAVEARSGAGSLFARVVHISPEAVAASYNADTLLKTKSGKPRKLSKSQQQVLDYIESGAIMSFRAWLELLAAGQM